MAILGLARFGKTFRFVLCNDSHGALTTDKFGEVIADSWTDAITALADETGATSLAVAVEAPDCIISEVDVANVPRAADKRRAVRLKAFKANFTDADDVRVRVDEDGNWYYAALRGDVRREIVRAAAGNKMKIVRIENAAYAWVRFLDNHFHALVDASIPDRVVALIVGGRRAEMRIVDSSKSGYLGEIDSAFRDAERHGFAAPIKAAALIDPNGVLQTANIGTTVLEAYRGAVTPGRLAYVVPLGVAFAAVGGQSPSGLLDVDFSPRESLDISHLLEPIVHRLPQGDLVIVGATVGLILLASFGQWMRATHIEMQIASMQSTLSVQAAQVDAIRAQATTVAQDAKRFEDAQAARQSGGVAARRLAAWMHSLPGGVSLTTVTYDGATGVATVNGNARDGVLAETAYQVINEPSAAFAQTGSTFSIQPRPQASASAAPPSSAANATPAPIATAAPTPTASAGGVASPAPALTSAPAAPQGSTR